MTHGLIENERDITDVIFDAVSERWPGVTMGDITGNDYPDNVLLHAQGKSMLFELMVLEDHVGVAVEPDGNVLFFDTEEDFEKYSTGVIEDMISTMSPEDVFNILLGV